MGTRGRKSEASLSVAPVVNLTPLPPAPSNLTKPQADVWRMVIASRGGDLIAPEAYPVLVGYCRAIADGDDIQKEIAEFDPSWRKTDEGFRRWKFLLTMRTENAKLAESLAKTLRIAPSSRILPRGAGRAQEKGAKRKPWEMDGAPGEP